MGLVAREKVEAMAPDQASLSAGVKLHRSGVWPTRGVDTAMQLLWAECQGSGAQPYRVSVALDDHGYKCSCPSRKFPCKHVLAVLLAAADAQDRFEAGPAPDWVKDWAARRRKSGGGAPREGDKPKSLDAAEGETLEAPAAVDEKAAERAAAQRERVRAEREASIAAGLDQLDAWLLDQLESGLVSFAAAPARACAALSKRLVDAKAGGLASALDQLAADLARTPSAERAALAIERLGGLELAASAYRRLEALPPALREDVRRAIGWTLRREELLAREDALKAAGAWLVIGAREEIQPDRLRRVETWLAAVSPAPERPAFAVLIDFIPAGGGAGSALSVGERFDGELAFYPSAFPQRAIVATRGPVTAGTADGVTVCNASGVGAAWRKALAEQPMLPTIAAALIETQLVETDTGLALQDESGLLPLSAAGHGEMLPLLGLSLAPAFVLFDGKVAELLSAMTSVGLWERT